MILIINLNHIYRNFCSILRVFLRVGFKTLQFFSTLIEGTGRTILQKKYRNSNSDPDLDPTLNFFRKLSQEVKEKVKNIGARKLVFCFKVFKKFKCLFKY